MASATELVFRTHTFKIARRGLSVMGATGPRSYMTRSADGASGVSDTVIGRGMPAGGTARVPRVPLYAARSRTDGHRVHIGSCGGREPMT